MKYIETDGWCISDNGEWFTDGYYSRYVVIYRLTGKETSIIEQEEV